MRRLAASALAGAALALATAGAGSAHGDLASEYLVDHDVFSPYDARDAPRDVQELQKLVSVAQRRGFRIKVALIASPADMAALRDFWRQPQRYASWVGHDMTGEYSGRILVVMPNGYGFFDDRKPVGPELRVLAALPPPESRSQDFAQAAILGVRKAAAARGIHLPEPEVASTKSSSSRDRAMLLAIFGGAAILVAAALALARRFRA